jgi:hypothetical protein
MKSVVVVGRNFFVGRDYFEEEPMASDEAVCKVCHEINKKIFVTVTGGIADVMEETVPEGYEVEVIDFDNINAGDDFPSEEAKEYSKSKGWA